MSAACEIGCATSWQEVDSWKMTGDNELLLPSEVTFSERNLGDVLKLVLSTSSGAKGIAAELNPASPIDEAIRYVECPWPPCGGNPGMTWGFETGIEALQASPVWLWYNVSHAWSPVLFQVRGLDDDGVDRWDFFFSAPEGGAQFTVERPVAPAEVLTVTYAPSSLTFQHAGGGPAYPVGMADLHEAVGVSRELAGPNAPAIEFMQLLVLDTSAFPAPWAHYQLHVRFVDGPVEGVDLSAVTAKPLKVHQT